ANVDAKGRALPRLHLEGQSQFAAGWLSIVPGVVDFGVAADVCCRQQVWPFPRIGIESSALLASASTITIFVPSFIISSCRFGSSTGGLGGSSDRSGRRERCGAIVTRYANCMRLKYLVQPSTNP